MNKSRNIILVAVDFEGQSLAALEQSFSLARLFKASILLLYVIEEGSGFSKLISPDDYHKRVLEKAMEKFDEIEHLARVSSHKEQVPVSYLIEKGKPYDKILKTAVDNDALLIVMGKGGVDAKKKAGFIGSNTLNVVRQALCPVITLSSAAEVKEFKNILMPIDFTGHTKIQVSQAIDFGKYFEATINVLSIIITENKINKLLRQVQLNQVKSALLRNNVNCQSEIILNKQKHVAEEICDYAWKIKTDLIIIMTQQKKQYSRFFIGTNAQEIISSSNIPVMSINPGARFHPEILTSFVDPLGLMKIKQKTQIR